MAIFPRRLMENRCFAVFSSLKWNAKLKRSSSSFRGIYRMSTLHKIVPLFDFIVSVRHFDKRIYVYGALLHHRFVCAIHIRSLSFFVMLRFCVHRCCGCVSSSQKLNEICSLYDEHNRNKYTRKWGWQLVRMQYGLSYVSTEWCAIVCVACISISPYSVKTVCAGRHGRTGEN